MKNKYLRTSKSKCFISFLKSSDLYIRTITIQIQKRKEMRFRNSQENLEIRLSVFSQLPYMRYGFIDSAKIERKISKKRRKLFFLLLYKKLFMLYVAKLTLLHFLSGVSIVKFVFSKKVTKINEIFTFNLTLTTYSLFMTSESPKYSNSNSPNLL